MRFHHTPTSVYLGRFRGHDLYFDDPFGLPTVVARYGAGASDYRSGLFWAEFDPILNKAKEISFNNGLITEEDIEEATDLDDEISSCPACREAEKGSHEDTICEYHMKELKEHYTCVLGEPADFEVSHVCVH